MKIDITYKIDELHQIVEKIKSDLKKAQDINNQEDIRNHEQDLEQYANQRWAVKCLYAEAICKTFNMPIEDLFDIATTSLDISKLQDDYSVCIIVEKKSKE